MGKDKKHGIFGLPADFIIAPEGTITAAHYGTYGYDQWEFDEVVQKVRAGRAVREEGSMIDVYYWTTPNGHKMAMFFEKTGLEHRFIPVNLQKNEQTEPTYLKLAPNGKIPAIIDLDPAGGGEPVPLFESGCDSTLPCREIRKTPSEGHAGAG